MATNVFQQQQHRHQQQQQGQRTHLTHNDVNAIPYDTTYAVINSNRTSDNEENQFKTMLTRIFDQYNKQMRDTIVVDFFNPRTPLDPEWYYIACSSLRVKTNTLKLFLSQKLRINERDIDFEIRSEVAGNKAQQFITFRQTAIFPERFMIHAKSNGHSSCCRSISVRRIVFPLLRLLFYLMLIVLSITIIKMVL